METGPEDSSGRIFQMAGTAKSPTEGTRKSLIKRGDWAAGAKGMVREGLRGYSPQSWVSVQ